MRLETNRLVIEPFTESDKMDWFLIETNPLVRKFLPGELPTQAQSFDYVEKSLSSYVVNGFGRYAVRFRETDELIGMCGYLLEDYGIDFGYRYLPKFWGRGIGYEAARSVLDFGVNNVQSREIISLVANRNIASLKIIEKLGFSFVGNENYAGYENVLKYSMKTSFNPK